MSSTRATPHDPDGIELNHSNCWSQELCCTGCQPNRASGWTGGQGLRWLCGGWANLPVCLIRIAPSLPGAGPRSHLQALRGHLCRSRPLPSSSAHSMLESSWTIGSGAPSGPVPDPSRVQHRAARQLQYAAAIASREVKEGLSARAVSAPAQLPAVWGHWGVTCPDWASGSPCQHMLALVGGWNWPTLTPPTWSPCLPGAGQGAMPKHPVPETPCFQRGRASAVGRVCRRVRRGHSQTCGSIEAGGCDACGPGLMGWAETGLCVCSSHLRVDGQQGLVA